ncbi:PKD domain-containing protein [Candidatus Poseidoniaceae archaeon]|nr:PKD domain-containing protein [Candidatus Poseidoniaceae archaeon]
MKTNFRLFAVTVTLLCASLAGCFGDDEEDSGEYDGPIDLIVFYDTTAGMIEISQNNNGGPGTTTGVELSFDFADTTSDDGSITKIMIDPDDGSNPVEGDPADNAVISYTWITHGVFTVTLSAEDNEGNSHSIMVKVKIDMHIVWTDQSTTSSSMDINATPDCEDGDPLPDRITISSSVTNQDDGFFGGSNSDVTWSLNNPSDEEISSNTGTIGEGQTQTWDYTTRDTVEGNWKINVNVAENGDNVNVNNDVTIAYAEGAEDPTNSRPE